MGPEPISGREKIAFACVEKASSQRPEKMPSNPRRASTKHESTQPNTSGDLCRRNFLQLLSPGTVGPGFGVSIFTRGYAMAEETDKEPAHQLLMQGTEHFKGGPDFRDCPNGMFYQTTYAGIADLWQLAGSLLS
jgi:hypothetical protein